MPDVTQNVIIEFISDASQLAPAVDQLEKLGKIEKGQAANFKATNDAIKSRATTSANTNKTVKDLSNSLSKESQVLKLSAQAFRESGKTLEQMVKAVKSGNVEIKANTDATTKNIQVQSSLRAQLRQMVEQLAQMKASGQANTKQFEELAKKAGVLKDALNDANQEVKNFSSDTSTFDGLISAVSGAAGAFAVVQGAAALFGDESEELQKTLLKVNAAMAILQGLQQVQIVLQKESAASQLANTIATKAQAAAQLVWNFIIGSSTGLLKAFRIALAATGVGLLVIGIYELVQAFKASNDEMEKANELIETQKALMEGLNQIIQRSTDIEIARLQAAGAAQSEVIRANGRALQRQRSELRVFNNELRTQAAALDKTSEAWFELNKAIEENENTIKGLDNQIIVTSINLEGQLAEERKQAAEKRKQDNKQAFEDAKRKREEDAQREKELRAAGFADFKATIELELLAAEKGSQEELEIRKRLLRTELQISLDNDKLTENQRKLLVKKFFADRLELEKQFAKDRDKIILENIGSDIQAELQALELSFERKLELTETAILLQAQLEIDAAGNNAAKITEINAKRDKAIRDARIASIQEVVNYEIALAEATGGPEKRRLQSVIDNAQSELQAKKSAIDQIAQIDSSAIQKRIDALNKERQQGLISQKDYNLQYAQLVDQQVKIWDDAEKAKTAATKKASDERNARTKQDIQNTASVAQATSDILAGLNDIQAEQQNQKLARDRQNIKDLQDAGAITEKEALARMKKLDAEERKIKQQQAKRDKEIALFNAIIATARGVAEAIPNPFLIALAAAIGAAQIAIIASKPIPKFGRGKKGSYEGLAEVGETGAELIERNGRMHVADKKQIVWLGKKDKVYNPMETIAMMSKPAMSRERNGHTIVNNKGIEIDYDKMGKAVGKHVQTNVWVDGIQQSIIKQKEFINYLDSKRNF